MSVTHFAPKLRVFLCLASKTLPPGVCRVLVMREALESGDAGVQLRSSFDLDSDPLQLGVATCTEGSSFMDNLHMDNITIIH